MTTIPTLSRTLNEVLTDRAEALARVSGFVRRRSKLSGSVFVQTLVFGWLGTPMAGIGALSRVAGALGVRITPQGLEQRFTKEAATYLQQVLAEGVQRLVEREPAAVPILQRFNGVDVQDSTTVPLPDELAAAWPACGNSKEPEDETASLKLQVRLELTRGTVAGPEPHAGRASDRATVTLGTPLPAGALFIAALGYFSLPHLGALGAAGVYWLSRLQVQPAVCTTDGRRLDLLAWLREHATTPAVAIDQPVLADCWRSASRQRSAPRADGS